MEAIIRGQRNKIFFGSDFEYDLINIFKIFNLSGMSLVLVAGLKSFNNSGYRERLINIFEDFGLNIVDEIKVGSNPDIKDLELIRDIEKKIDIIFCIGGGSVIDFGKLLKLRKYKNSNLIAIYTMPGSGTIVTPFAVFNSSKFKIAEQSDDLIPVVAYINKEIIDSIPVNLKLAALGDIYAHAMESSLTTLSNRQTKLLSEESLNILSGYTDNIKSISAHDLITADILAAIAESQALVLFPHAVGHYLTFVYGVPHAIASLYCMKNFLLLLESHNSKIDKNYLVLLEKIIAELDVRELLPRFIIPKEEKNTILELIKKHMHFVFDIAPIFISDEDYKGLI